MKTVSTPFGDEATLRAFINEGTLATQIRHPNVVEYLFFHDGATYDGLPPYILMEFADGGTLQTELEVARRNRKMFSKEELKGLFRQLAAGMKAINQTLVHRDVKPDNILVSGGCIKISDFGLSKVVVEATRKSTFKGMGCVAYMAPEAWRFEKNTPQLDIYAMGIVFYELATLRHPFDVRTPDPQKWMEAHMYSPVTSPEKVNVGLDTKLAHIIMRMIEKDSRKRFSDWTEIEQLLDSEGSRAENGNALLEAMLKRRLQQDTSAQSAAAEQSRKAKERLQFCKLVISQIEPTIIKPIQELIDEFNRHYSSAKASISEGSSNDKQTSYQLYFPSGNRVEIVFRVCLEEDFVRETRHNDYGRVFTGRKVAIPRLRDRPVQGWGFIKGSDARGVNLVLVETAGELYGEFMMLVNKMGIPANVEQRPEPFPFDFDELEEEIRRIGAIHIYSTDIREFDPEFIKEFVANYV